MECWWAWLESVCGMLVSCILPAMCASASVSCACLLSLEEVCMYVYRGRAASLYALCMHVLSKLCVPAGVYWP